MPDHNMHVVAYTKARRGARWRMLVRYQVVGSVRAWLSNRWTSLRRLLF